MVSCGFRKDRRGFMRTKRGSRKALASGEIITFGFSLILILAIFLRNVKGFYEFLEGLGVSKKFPRQVSGAFSSL